MSHRMTESLAQADRAGAAGDATRWWQRLDPRRHFALALGLALFVPILGGAIVAAELAAAQAQRHVLIDTQARLVQMAGQADDALLGQVQVRLAALQAAAAQWRLDAARDVLAADRLRALQQQHPELNWIGVQGADGSVQVATEEQIRTPGDDGRAAWLDQATRTPLVVLHRSRGAGDSDALVLAVPFTTERAGPASLLVARLPWLWLQAQVDARLRAMAGGVPVEMLLLDARGRLLAGPPGVLADAAPVDPSAHGRYLVGQLPPPAADDVSRSGAGWRVLVRQDAALALAPARRARDSVLFGVLAVGLLAALAAALLARWLLWRLQELARQARAVARGEQGAITPPRGRDEVHAIGATLAELVAGLQAEKAALAQLNAELDTRVAERTARIERLARGARRAATTRERLRLARALHDTLAHSLMALLTQLRMVRKLGARWSPAQLDAELADAEQVASSGLAEVRGAIRQMRAAGLHDSGLAAELQALLQGLARDAGVQVQAHIDPAADELVDARAAIVLNMAREALRNIARHARARHVTLALAPEPPGADATTGATRGWRLELADDGVGFDPAVPAAGHYGLVGLREQAVQLGAALTLDSAPGQGCRLQLRFAA